MTFTNLLEIPLTKEETIQAVIENKGNLVYTVPVDVYELIELEGLEPYLDLLEERVSEICLSPRDSFSEKLVGMDKETETLYFQVEIGIDYEYFLYEHDVELEANN